MCYRVAFNRVNLFTVIYQFIVKIPTSTVIAGCCILCSSAAGQTRDFKVIQFPEAAYIDEQSTFVVKAEQGAPVEAYLGDRKLAADSSGKPVRELNLVLPDSGMLRFKSGTKSISFHVVKPSDDVRLREKDGYLYSRTGPAILLMKHRHPPKHSRKWEVVKVLVRFVFDTRPKTESGTLVYGNGAGGVDVRAIAEHSGFPASFWRQVKTGNNVSRINGMVEKAGDLPKSDVVLLAMSFDDLERGISELLLRMKLEWCLQVLEHRDFKHVFVVSPVVTKRQLERYPDVNGAVRIAAGGNSAQPVTIFATNEKRPLTTGEWISQVEAAMGRIVKWESGK